MPSQKILRCHTKHRMQRLLWTPEYESYISPGSGDEPIVLVESPFVMETKSDGVEKMVYVCLTTECLLIAEENLKKPGEKENMMFYEPPVITTACRRNDDAGREGDWDLQDFSLKYMFPLQHVRLSIRHYREKEGEHVLRLRLGEETGDSHLKTWYLELAGRHRDVVWGWWMEWIEELEERRKEQRHRIKVYKKNMQHDIAIKYTEVHTFELGALNLDYHRDTHGLIMSSDQKKSKPRVKFEDESGDAGRLQHRERLQARHIEEHVKRTAKKHPEHLIQHESATDFLTTKVTEGDIISRCTQYGIPVPSVRPCTPSFYTKLGLPVPDDLTVVDGHDEDDLDSCSSLEDILSLGSLVDSDVDWHEAVSMKVNDRLVLCVGNLFEKSNVEMHDHGHLARVRPFGSDTALDKLLEFEESNLSIYDKHHLFIGIDKEKLHHTNSIPDILEGEPAFLEDDYEASQVTHRTSFVAMDIENENTKLQAHIINGHALLVTKKELRLEKELIKFREESHDLDFTTCKHIGRRHMYGGKHRTNRHIGMMEKLKKQRKKKKEHGMKYKLMSKLHIEKGGSTTKDFVRQPVLRAADLPEWAVDLPDRITTISEEIPPEAMARELTLIDKELFLMIHESELVDCMWMKHDKHTKAPNVMQAIEFFERVVRTVSAEIVKKNYDWARAKAMAYFTKVAAICFELQNFHSLKAILCGMQVPSIYRLKYSWSDFEEQYPDEYRVFTSLAHLMADEGCSTEYFAHLQEAELKPPYLPFLGAFFKNLIGLFTIKDEFGMRTQHKKMMRDDGGRDEHDCSMGTCYHDDADDDDDDDTSVDEDNSFSNIFQKVHDMKSSYNWVTAPSHNVVVNKSPAYQMNETLFHYQIAAIQYRWVDLPQIRDYWLRNQLPDEVDIWNKSCEKEDLTRTREERGLRMARKARIEEEYQRQCERRRQRLLLAEEAAAHLARTSQRSKMSIFVQNRKKKKLSKRGLLSKLNEKISDENNDAAAEIANLASTSQGTNMSSFFQNTKKTKPSIRDRLFSKSRVKLSDEKEDLIEMRKKRNLLLAREMEIRREYRKRNEKRRQRQLLTEEANAKLANTGDGTKLSNFFKRTKKKKPTR